MKKKKLDTLPGLITVLMTAHRWWMYGMETEIDLNHLPVSHTEHIPQVFGVSFSKGTSK